uniref:Uncharacterized protein n=1 Tax=Anopheles albimanus TaxID=7167 RepID=A0A182FFM3_ANOAL
EIVGWSEHHRTLPNLAETTTATTATTTTKHTCRRMPSGAAAAGAAAGPVFQNHRHLVLQRLVPMTVFLTIVTSPSDPSPTMLETPARHPVSASGTPCAVPQPTAAALLDSIRSETKQSSRAARPRGGSLRTGRAQPSTVGVTDRYTTD